MSNINSHDEPKPEINEPLLRDLFEKQPYSVDMLPHTDEEIELYKSYNKIVGDENRLTLRELYITLMNMRKSSKLPKKSSRRTHHYGA